MSDLLHPYYPSMALSSLSTSLLTVPRFSFKTFGKRSFSVFWTHCVCVCVCVKIDHTCFQCLTFLKWNANVPLEEATNVLVGWLVGWLAGWLVGWSVCSSRHALVSTDVQVRLAPGSSGNQGRVEVRRSVNGTWNELCGLDEKSVAVVCRQVNASYTWGQVSSA